MDTPAVKRFKLADPQHLIAQARARLNPKCSVRLSPYCDIILSMRLQGTPFRHIERWLTEQGPQYRIPETTLNRNLTEARVEAKLTYAEEVLESYGGQAEIDLVREMSQCIWTQKERLDRMVRGEQERRKEPGREFYINKGVRQELETYHHMLKDLHTILTEAPMKAREAEEAEARRRADRDIAMTDDAVSVLRDLILNNELAVGPQLELSANYPDK